MSSLMSSGDPPVTRCALCTRDAAGPCALTTGGATTFAVCLSCVRRGGASLTGAWWSTLLWLGAIILGVATVGVVLMLLR